MWEKLTGIKTNVVELAWPDLYSKAVAEHIAGSGAYDVLDVAPMWTPSLADGGVIQPLDDYIAKYMNAADLDDYHPLYKALPTYKGKIWGFFDDGDIFALYYRKDIFEDPKLMEAYQAKFGAPLAPPKTWPEYIQIAQFITDNLAPERLRRRATSARRAAPATSSTSCSSSAPTAGSSSTTNMKAAIASDAGVKTLQNMIAANNASIPGNNELDAVSLWAAFLTGKVAMIYSWPPSGRMSAGYSQTATAINFIPQSQIAGKVGYAVVPGNPEHATGFNKALAADSANPDAAYLMMQWMTSPPVSLARVMLPYALRDPYRLSHFKSDLYAALWPDAKAYLDQPQQLGQRRPARPDHPRRAGLFPVDRPDGDLGLGRRRPEGRAGDRGGGVGRDHRPARRRLAEGLLHRVPEAPRRDRRQHRREARPGREPRR